MAEERSATQFVQGLGRHSILMGLLVVVISLGTLLGALNIARGLGYEAKALILSKAGARITLPVTSAGGGFADPGYDPARLTRNAQVLLRSLDIADKVKARAAQESDPAIKALAADERTTVRGLITISSQDDLFYVQAKTPSAALSTWLANNWAAEAVAAVNQTYAASSTFRVNDALADAQKQLAHDEQALQDYQRTSRLNELNQQRTQTQQLLDAAAKSNTDVQILLYKQQRDLAQTYQSGYLKYAADLDGQLLQLAALRHTIEQGGDDASILLANQAALNTLVRNALISPAGSSASNNPVQLQVNPSTLTTPPAGKAVLLQNVDSVVTAVQGLQTQLRAQATTLQATLDQPLPTVAPQAGQAIPAVVQGQIAELNRLTSTIEQVNFETNQLQKTRDSSQNAYDLLRNHQTEQQLNAQFNSVVDVVQQADPTETLTSRNTTNTVLLTTALGVLFAVVLAVVLALLLTLLAPRFDSNALIRRRGRRTAATRPPQTAADEA
ncbi:MAG: hypothetical protein M3Z04_17505 [Chloroflexota bacterium]|nr:hypothetical protein [Chloroflexota bacterium]